MKLCNCEIIVIIFYTTRRKVKVYRKNYAEKNENNIPQTWFSFNCKRHIEVY